MYKDYNAEAVLNKVNACIEELERANNGERFNWDRVVWTRTIYHRWRPDEHKHAFKMDAVFEELSIFDWWNGRLSISQLKEMKAFLTTAIKMGYTGYVCFKVGATCCANGMWAHKEESTDGYSPDGEFLYRSFTPDYIAWDARLSDGTFAETHIDKKYDEIRLADIKKLLASA